MSRLRTVRWPGQAESRRGRGGRCLIAFAGYYEWQARPEGGKPPHDIHPAGDAPALSMAGLCPPVRCAEVTGLSAAVITEPARAPLDAVHDRMPLLRGPEAGLDWLAGAAPERLARLPMAAWRGIRWARRAPRAPS